MMPSSSATSSSGPYLSKAFQRYDALKDFTQVGLVARFDVVIVTRAPANTMTPGNWWRRRSKAVTSGYGSGTGQVVAAAFSRRRRRRMGVPYKGQPAAVTDLLGGRIDFVAADLGAVLPQIRARNLNAVAWCPPSVRPSCHPCRRRELGMGSLDLTGWIGVAGPRPDAGSGGMVVRPTDGHAARTRGARALACHGMEPDLIVGEPLQQFVRAQYEAWGQQIRDAGIQPE